MFHVKQLKCHSFVKKLPILLTIILKFDILLLQNNKKEEKLWQR